MFVFDSKIPSEILSIQKWFAKAITCPMDSQEPLIEGSERYIAPNSKLSSGQRIQIYQQQYWWRLLSILHQNFPVLTRLFGYSDYNRTIAIPFLDQYPSRHWSLGRLGDALPKWIEENYTAKDLSLVHSAALIDWAYQELFFAPEAVDQEASLDLLSKKLMLQEHVKIFSLPFDLFSFRKELLKEKVEFWGESDFPALAKERKYHFIVWRNLENQIVYKEIEEGQWTLLHLVDDGLTIEEASEYLEKKGGSIYEEALCSFQEWIQEWMREYILKEIHDGK